MTGIPPIKERYLVGVRFWALWHGYVSYPMYEIYEYIGRNEDKSVFFFQRRPTKYDGRTAITWLRWEDLGGEAFKPFVLDPERCMKVLEEKGHGTAV